MGVLVPAGTAHAIDGGIFVAEVQEPTDFSILLEWSVTTSTREESHLDLGFETVMPAVSTRALGEAELARLVTVAGATAPERAPRSVLPAAADPYFRLDTVAALGGSSAQIDAGFAVALVDGGEGAIASADGRVDIRRGEAYVVPFDFGAWHIEGDASVLVCRPGAGWPATLHTGGVR